MAKLTRVTGKVFGGDATATVGGIGQFGSAAIGTPNPTTDVATIQALQAYSNGWGSAVVTSRNFPPIEEVTGVLKTISYQACYTLQEGIPEYDIGTEYSNTSIVKSISGTQLVLYVSLQNGNIGHSLTDTDWWAQVTFVGSSPIGSPQITFNFNAVLPDNCIWLEGQAISRTTYSTLFGIYGTTYGAGDGSTTFNLPDCRNRVLWGSNSAGYISAGLPNIKGTIGTSGVWNYAASATGAFTVSQPSASNRSGDGGTDCSNATWTFNASRNAATASQANGIYRDNCYTVQPPAIKVRVYTRYQ